MNIIPPRVASGVECLLHPTRAMSKTSSGYFARIIKQLFFAIVVLVVSVPTVRAGEPVDLLLVLAADVSFSIAGQQFKLQREGYAQAITSPRVIRVIQSGVIGRIAICFIEWSGEIFQDVVVNWTLIGDVEGARLGDFMTRTPVLAGQPQQLGDGIAQGP